VPTLPRDGRAFKGETARWGRAIRLQPAKGKGKNGAREGVTVRYWPRERENKPPENLKGRTRRSEKRSIPADEKQKRGRKTWCDRGHIWLHGKEQEIKLW